MPCSNVPSRSPTRVSVLRQRRYHGRPVPTPTSSLPERAITTAPDWVSERADAGARAAVSLDLPGRGDEAWKYLELDLDLSALVTAPAGAPATPEGVFLEGIVDRAGTARVVDGRPGEIDLRSEGPVLSSISRAAIDHEGKLRDTYLNSTPVDRDLFSALHHAAAPDGVFLLIPPGFVESRPFVLDVEASAIDAVSYPHITIVAETGSQASIILNTRSEDAGHRLVVPQIETAVGDGANLTITRAQHWGRGTSEFGYHRVLLGRDATVRLGDVGLGGSTARLDLTVDLAGRGSSFEMMGAYFGDQSQVMDYRVVINHRAPNTSSNVFLKGAVQDSAESVFSGLLKIFPDASQVSAFETNRNLVLSENAKAHSVPNLEILCDDVVCGHGSTVGPLEAEHVYYLQSRGLPRDRAERLLVRGFFEEIIQAIPEDLAEPTRDAFNRKFVAAQEAGRV